MSALYFSFSLYRFGHDPIPGCGGFAAHGSAGNVFVTYIKPTDGTLKVTPCLVCLQGAQPSGMRPVGFGPLLHTGYQSVTFSRSVKT